MKVCFCLIHEVVQLWTFIYTKMNCLVRKLRIILSAEWLRCWGRTQLLGVS